MGRWVVGMLFFVDFRLSSGICSIVFKIEG